MFVSKPSFSKIFAGVAERKILALLSSRAGQGKEDQGTFFAETRQGQRTKNLVEDLISQVSYRDLCLPLLWRVGFVGDQMPPANLPNDVGGSDGGGGGGGAHSLLP